MIAVIARPERRAAPARLAAVLLALVLASCAPIPPQGAPQPPPQGTSPRPSAPSLVSPPPKAEALIDREPLLDVGIGVDLDSLTLVPSRPTTIQTEGSENATHQEIGSPISARMAGNDIEITWQDGGGEPRTLGVSRGDTVWIGRDELLEPENIGVQDCLQWRSKTWRGRLKLFINSRNRLTLATRLPLEMYLLGVVPEEIGGLSDALVQAGRAQAIAARSYTLFYKGRRGVEGFDLYGTVEDQVFGPIESERPLATRCVTGTSGTVALWEGRPIRANYCSTCGGITADVWEGWPAETLPYLMSERDRGRLGDYCAESKVYRWREEWPAAEFLENLAQYGPVEGVSISAAGVGSLIDVQIESRSRSGRVWALEVVTTTGEFRVPAYSLRRVLRRSGNRQAILRSNLFKIDVKRDPSTLRAISVIASGAGSGHGVGLCQTGAIGMARAGATSDAIIRHYYAGIELKRLY